MHDLIKSIRDWSEVWALLIPLAILLRFAIREKNMRPIIIYVWVGLLLSLASTTMFVFHKQMPDFLKNNNLIYNIHSSVRVILFSWFIRQFRFGRTNNLHLLILLLYGVFVVINFLAWDSLFHFSNTHFIAESIVLLISSILFFLRCIQDDSDTDWIKEPAFIVCAGICLYEAVNFFTFLFFETLSIENLAFLRVTWTIHNMCFVVLCIMLALALYRSRINRPAPRVNS